jgi:hypothetical protein
MASNVGTSSSCATHPGYREGSIARGIERQTAKIPSDTWLWAAFGEIGASLYFQMNRNKKTANFIGHWAPTPLLMGIYNKLVKLHGSDAFEKDHAA